MANVPSVRVQPVFRLNGKTFPSPRAGVGIFTLWASEPNALYSGPQLVLGHGHDQGLKVRVVPGVYDVYYSWVSGDAVPRNEWARVMRQVTLQNAFERTPNRFKNRLPQPHRLPTAAWINPPIMEKKAA